MNKDSKQLSCLNHAYIHNPSLINSGRVIKALRSLEPNSIEKQKIDFTIYKYLQKHIIYLQEAIINSYGKQRKINTIDTNLANKLKQLAKSQYCVNEGKMSMVDIDHLKQFELENSYLNLKNSVVLPMKIKTENNYKFNTLIVFSNNVSIGYNNYGYDEEVTLSNKNQKIEKIDKKLSSLLSKDNKNTISSTR